MSDKQVLVALVKSMMEAHDAYAVHDDLTSMLMWKTNEAAINLKFNKISLRIHREVVEWKKRLWGKVRDPMLALITAGHPETPDMVNIRNIYDGLDDILDDLLKEMATTHAEFKQDETQFVKQIPELEDLMQLTKEDRKELIKEYKNAYAKILSWKMVFEGFQTNWDTIKSECAEGFKLCIKFVGLLVKLAEDNGE